MLEYLLSGYHEYCESIEPTRLKTKKAGYFIHDGQCYDDGWLPGGEATLVPLKVRHSVPKKFRSTKTLRKKAEVLRLPVPYLLGLARDRVYDGRDFYLLDSEGREWGFTTDHVLHPSTFNIHKDLQRYYQR